MNTIKTLSRRRMLHRSARALGSIMLAPIVFHVRCADADSGNRAMLHYQDSPKDGKRCADCTAFKPGGRIRARHGHVQGHRRAGQPEWLVHGVFAPVARAPGSADALQGGRRQAPVMRHHGRHVDRVSASAGIR